MPKSPCPNQDDLSQYLLGTLSEKRADELARHVAGCTRCESTLDTLEDRSDPLIDRLREPAPMDRYRQEPQCREAISRAESVGLEQDGPGSGVEMSEVSPGEEDPLSGGPKQLGEYELIEELGRGGMGTVYRAMHTRLERQVALKVLPQDRVADPRAIARFEREMKAVGRLSHTNIVQATDARSIGSTHFLVMEYVEGLDLAEIVSAHGVLRVPDACEVIRQAALGLQCAHEHGLVHRDIKPSNLMLTPQGVVKVLDLGLARFQSQPPEGPGGEEMTAANQAMGTADYMAPEQVSDVRSADIRADIYSLGCTLYKLLAGQAPFGGPDFARTFDKMVAHVQAEPPSIRNFRTDLPDELVALLERMLAKAPDDRYATPAEVADQLVTFTAGNQLAALLPGADAQAGPAAPTNRSLDATNEYVSSAMVGTRPTATGQPVPVLPATQAGGRRIHWVVLAVALAFFMAAVALVVVIRIRDREGRETVVRVPEGSEVIIEPASLEKPQPVVPEKPQPKPPTVVVKPPVEEPPAEKPPIEKPQEKPIEKPAAKPVVEKPVAKPDEPPMQPPAEKPVVAPAEKPAAKPDRVDVPIVPKPEKPPVEKPPAKPQTIAEKILRQPAAAPLGGPAGKAALVAQPAPIKGVASWTIETLGHRGAVYDVAYSPDGTRVATACGDGVVRLWDARTREVQTVLAAYDGRIGCLAWAPDSSALSCGCEDWSVRVWDVASGQTLRVLRGHLGDVRSVAFSPDGLRLASASADKTVRLWKLTETGLPKVLRGHEADVTCVAFSPDGALLASGSYDKTVRVWRASGTLRHTLLGHSAAVFDVDFSASGGLLASAGASSQSTDSIHVWDVAEGGMLYKLPGHTFGDTSVAFSPNEQLLAAGGAPGDPSVRVWDVGGRQLLHTLAKPIARQAAWCVAFSPDGQTLVAGDGGGVVQFWEALSGSKLEALPSMDAKVQCVAFSSDAAVLATGYEDGAVRTFLTESGKPVRRFPAGAAAVRKIAFSPDDRWLAACYADSGLVDVWDGGTGERLSQLRNGRSTIEYLLWSADSTTIAVGDGTGKLWEAESGTALSDLPSHGTAMAWSPDGATLAIAVGGDVRLFPGGVGRPTMNLFSSREPIRSLAFSPDGTTLAGGSDDRQVYLWKVEETAGKPSTLKGHKATPTCLVWLEDETTLLSGSKSEICEWKTASGKQVRQLKGDGTAIAPSGKTFAAREQGMLRLRDLADGSLLRSIISLPDRGYLALNPQGHYRSGPGTEAGLVYLVRTGEGQQMLTPDEFAQRYGWRNDPEQVLTWTD